MLFNSGEFFFFFIAVYLLYLILPHRGQNILLLLGSYFFYGYWDWRFLGLIFISTIVDYSAGLSIQSARDTGKDRIAKRWLILSIIVNLGILGFFKYFNYFADSFVSVVSLFGWQPSYITLKIILPVGISFYTFQTMSYTIDVYRGIMKPTRHFFDFALFVSFFPQLMAGPIERARRLLPQIQKKRNITYNHLSEGGWLLFWGLFKKVFIADSLAPYSLWGVTFQQSPTGVDIYIASFAFIIQFYCDFSGYSDMARGLASLMGFKLSLNFNLPYFATNPAQLWQKWHITLSNWFRDYCYGPLRQVFKGRFSREYALVITMALVGLWHGASWRFVCWGFSWGVMMFIYRVIQPYLNRLIKKYHRFNFLFAFFGIIFIVNVWILLGQFFVALDFSHAIGAIKIILTNWSYSENSLKDLIAVLYFTWPLILIQLSQYFSKNLDVVRTWPIPVRFALYIVLFFLLTTSGAEGGAEFIYFQF